MPNVPRFAGSEVHETPSVPFPKTLSMFKEATTNELREYVGLEAAQTIPQGKTSWVSNSAFLKLLEVRNLDFQVMRSACEQVLAKALRRRSR